MTLSGFFQLRTVGKPYLRSMMEHDMKAVSIGTKGKTEVLETCLRQMKACFLDARVNKVKLFEAMAVFFDRSNTSEQHIVGDVVRRCGLCQESDMVLRQKTDGKFMVGCLGYPQCRNAAWLPGCILEAVVTQDICSICTPGPVFKIRFKFRRLSIPPNFDAEHLGCVGGCDDTLKQLAEICGTGSRNSSSMPARGGHSTPSASAQQSNRGGAIQHLPLVPSEAILDRKLLVYTVGKQGIHQMIAPHKHPIGVLLSPNPSPMKLTDKMEYPPFLVIPVVLPVLYEPPTLQKIGAESSTLASPENAIFSYGRKMP